MDPGCSLFLFFFPGVQRLAAHHANSVWAPQEVHMFGGLGMGVRSSPRPQYTRPLRLRLHFLLAQHNAARPD